MDRNDKTLFKWSPNQIAAMSKEEAIGVIDFHHRNPPTMDYMVEFTRSMKEIRLAEQRIAELSDTETEIIEIAIETSRRAGPRES